MFKTQRRRVYLRLLILTALLLSYPLFAAAEAHKLEKLAVDPAWLALLQYEPSIRGKHHSLVDDPAFFFAARGHRDPLAELEATLAALRSPLLGDPDQHPLCRFPARAELLARHFADLRSRRAERECPGFTQWSQAINAHQLTLVFPSSFINNPGSTFGHTLLRLDSPAAVPLLSYAANYAAQTDGADNAFIYALKGTFGGYYGEFSVAPYYQKVTQYSDLEHRDIWEYQLNFSPAEVQQLVRYLWELRGITFDYFYFDENCSYLILALLEAVRPNLQLKSHFAGWVIPVDTLRVLREEPDLLGTVTYRPSRATVLKHLEKHSSPAALKQAAQLSQGRLAAEHIAQLTPSPGAQAQILDLAHEAVLFRLLSSTTSADSLRQQAHDILVARSKLPPSQRPPIAPPRVRPEEGHGTRRLRLSSGSADGRPLYRLEFRGTYHDLLDPAGGFLPGSAIELGNFSLEQRKKESLRLNQLTVFKAESWSSRGAFIKPRSWSLTADVRRLQTKADRPLLGSLGGGLGTSWEVDRVLLTVLARLGALGGAALQPGYALGAGAEAGALTQLTDTVGLRLSAEALRFGLGDQFTAGRWALESRWTLNPNQALRFGVERLLGPDRSESVALASWDLYF